MPRPEIRRTLVGGSVSAVVLFFTRVGFLTRLSVLSIVVGTGVLLAVAVPIGEVEELATYYAVFYYVLAAALSLLGGMVITMGLLIGLILRGVIAIGHSEGESDLLQPSDAPAGPGVDRVDH